MGKTVLDYMISGKWKRSIKPFIPVQPTATLPHRDAGLGKGTTGQSLETHPSKGQDFNTLRRECLANKVLFEDPTFPAGKDNLSAYEGGPYLPTIGI